MSHDRGVNSYSPEGRIYQIEYAMKAMNHGVTTVALTTKKAVIITSEKKILSKLQVIKNSSKHCQIDKRMGLAFSGISADASVIVEKSRKYMMNTLTEYDECSCIIGLLKKLCSQSLKFGESDPNKRIFSRPFGVSVLLAAYEECPKLYLLEPSGSYKQFKAKSIGNAYQALDTELLSRYDETMEENESITLSLKLLKDVMRDRINKENVETMIVSESGVRFLAEDDIDNYLVSVH